jgi:hypothetical protein
MNEFKKNDVVAEIGNNKKYFWIVREVVEDGYYFDAFFGGKFHVIGNWMSFRVAHRHLVKVDEWDDENNRMKNVEEI